MSPLSFLFLCVFFVLNTLSGFISSCVRDLLFLFQVFQIVFLTFYCYKTLENNYWSKYNIRVVIPLSHLSLAMELILTGRTMSAQDGMKLFGFSLFS